MDETNKMLKEVMEILDEKPRIQEVVTDDKRVEDRDLEEKKVEEFYYENEEKLESGTESDVTFKLAKKN